jgi:hypothetical protein
MAAFDHGFKILARSAGRELARLAGLHCETWTPVESTLQTTTERLADRVFRTKVNRQRFLVYMEFVTSWNAAIPWTLLAKAGLLAETERLPVQSVVFVLRRKGYRPQRGTMRLAVEGRPVQQIWFREVRLWETKPAKWWETIPALMALYPLCDHGQSGRESVLHAAEAIEHTEADSVNRADLLTTLGIFGRMAFPNLDVPNLIGREKMRESKFMQEFMDEARREEGLFALQAILEERFGKLTNHLKKQVGEIEDMNRLNELIRVAVRSASVDEFRVELSRTPAAAR